MGLLSKTNSKVLPQNSSIASTGSSNEWENVSPDSQHTTIHKTNSITVEDSHVSNGDMKRDRRGGNRRSLFRAKSLVKGVAASAANAMTSTTTSKDAELTLTISSNEFEQIVGQFRNVGALDHVDDDNEDDDGFSDEEGLLDQKISSKRSARRHRSRLIFRHDSTGRVSWDIVILVLLVYVMIVTPFRIGLDSPPTSIWKPIELMIDVAFIVDIFIQFRTSYINSQGVRETDGTKIATKYLSGYFTIDFVSSIPWDYVIPDAEGSAQTASQSTRVMKTLRLAKLMKLGRMARVQKFARTFNEYIHWTPEQTQVLTAITLLILCAHFLGCLWAFAGRYGVSMNSFAVDSWQSRAGLVDADAFDEYLFGLYWAVTCVTTVGLASVEALSTMELIVAVLAMGIGVVLYGYLTAVLTAFFLHEDPQRRIVKEKMDALSSYLTKHEYPRDMRRKIKAYFRHFYDNTSAFDDVQMLHQLPYTLYESAAGFLVQKLIKNFVIFAGIDQGVVALILKVLKPMSVSGDMIVKRGQPADTMFLINKGIVNITSRTGQIVGQFRAGQSFMEYGAFRMLRKHIYNAVAVSQCELYSLHADDILSLANDMTTKVRGDLSAYEGIGVLRQNVILLEQFRAFARCSLIDLDMNDDNFEKALVVMMLGDEDDVSSPVGGSAWVDLLQSRATSGATSGASTPRSAVRARKQIAKSSSDAHASEKKHESSKKSGVKQSNSMRSAWKMIQRSHSIHHNRHVPNQDVDDACHDGFDPRRALQTIDDSGPRHLTRSGIGSPSRRVVRRPSMSVQSLRMTRNSHRETERDASESKILSTLQTIQSQMITMNARMNQLEHSSAS